MRRLARVCPAVVALLAVIACGSPPPAPDTVSSSREFRLGISSERPVYLPTDPIEIPATVTYIGQAANVEVWSMGQPVTFLLEEVAGARRMGSGPGGLACTMTTLVAMKH